MLWQSHVCAVAHHCVAALTNTLSVDVLGLLVVSWLLFVLGHQGKAWFIDVTDGVILIPPSRLLGKLREDQ